MRKYWKYLRFLVIPAALLLAGGVIYFITDTVSDGVLADWLSRRFAYETTEQDGDVVRIVQWISWGAVKAHITNVLFVLVLLGSWIGIVVHDVVRQRTRRKHARELASFLQKYLLEMWNGPSVAGTAEDVLEHYRNSTFEHISILQFIRDGMAAEACQAMELHITRSMANMLRCYPETEKG